jgi:hypothetical protein
LDLNYFFFLFAFEWCIHVYNNLCLIWIKKCRSSNESEFCLGLNRFVWFFFFFRVWFGIKDSNNT